MNFSIAGYLRIKSSPNNAIWFINTNFLEAIKYFRLSIGAIMLRSSYPSGLSKLKKVTWMPKRRRRVWIMKLQCSIYDPLKQTKKALWCFARLTINSVSGCFRRFSGKFLKKTERLKRCIRLFSWLENSRRKFGFHVFKPFLNISFRLSRPFFIKRNWLRQTGNAITERNQNLSVLNQFSSLFAQTDRFTRVNSRKALCPKACDTASSHRYLPLGTFVKERWEAGVSQNMRYIS